MPRARRTQAPQTPGLEAGAAYGEVSDSLAAQSQMPLVQKGPPGTTGGLEAVPVPLPTQASASPLPLDAARGFTPNITPLMAPVREVRLRHGWAHRLLSNSLRSYWRVGPQRRAILLLLLPLRN